MSDQRNDILCIHYYFPPLRSTAIIRNYFISRTFATFFQKVHILTSDNHKKFPNEIRPIPENVFVNDIYTLDYRLLLANKSDKDAHLSSANKRGRLYKYLLKIQKSFPFNLLLAEGNVIYIINAYRKAKKVIQENNIDTIYTSFGPYADHYVGYLLKSKYPHIRWIADFRDLQIEPIYKNVIWEGLQYRIEKMILTKADLITCISNGFVDQLKKYNRPTIPVLRGVELRKASKQYEKFTIAYTGSLYFDYRDPRPLFECLRNLIEEGQLHANELDIIYAGRDGQQFGSWVDEYNLSKNFTDRGMLTNHEAKEIQNKSHINLLLTSSSPELKGVLTGKIFEYLEALNPILCLISGDKDPEFELLFDELSAGTVVYAPQQTKGKMRNFILDKYREWLATHRVQSSLNTTAIMKKYGWHQQVQKMFEMK